jgi:carboxylate-amine ligase
MMIEENRWRAKRDGTQMMFIDDMSGDAIPLATALTQLRELIGDQARALRCERTLQRLDIIITQGTSAHRQLEIYRERRNARLTRRTALRHVVDWLVASTIS